MNTASDALPETDAIALAMRNNHRLENGRLARAMRRSPLVVAEDTFKPDFNIGSCKRIEMEGGLGPPRPRSDHRGDAAPAHGRPASTSSTPCPRPKSARKATPAP